MNTAYISNQLKAIEIIEEMIELGSTKKEITARFPDALDYIEGAFILHDALSIDKNEINKRITHYSY